MVNGASLYNNIMTWYTCTIRIFTVLQIGIQVKSLTYFTHIHNVNDTSHSELLFMHPSPPSLPVFCCLTPTLYSFTSLMLFLRTRMTDKIASLKFWQRLSLEKQLKLDTVNQNMFLCVVSFVNYFDRTTVNFSDLQ